MKVEIFLKKEKKSHKFCKSKKIAYFCISKVRANL